MRKFIVNILAYLFPIGAVILGFNCFVDPSHVYSGSKYEKQMVEMLLASKKNVTNVELNYKERVFKSLWCENYSDSVDIVVLGNSRVMCISEKYFQGKRIMNLGVSSGSIEDECALMSACYTNGQCPKIVVLGVDPFHFNDYNDKARWKEIETWYNHYQTEVNGKRLSIWQRFNKEKWVNLFSLSYFQRSIRYHNQTKKNELIVTENFNNEQNTIHYDGSISYGESMRNRLQDETDEIARAYKHGQWYNFSCISREKTEELQGLIDYIKLHDSEIVLFLSPYHPLTWQRFMSQIEYKEVKNAEILVDRIAKENDLTVIGNWNPDICGCDKTCFYDAGHLREKGLDILFKGFQ
ncbi:MAG: hypothetical protein IJQ11_14000 [Bacteroidales bacterium]|nr:hypothetical protein [Bacteroidales bacterium]